MCYCSGCPLYALAEEMEHYGVTCDNNLGAGGCVDKLQDLVKALHYKVEQLEKEAKHE